MKFIFNILFFISITLPFNGIDKSSNDIYNQNNLNENVALKNTYDTQIINQHIDENIYKIGSGRRVWFNCYFSAYGRISASC